MFQKFSVATSVAVMKTAFTKKGLQMSPEAELALPELMGKLVEQHNFASGRDVSNWANDAESQLALRLFGVNSNLKGSVGDLISVDDLASSLASYLAGMNPSPSPPIVIGRIFSC